MQDISEPRLTSGKYRGMPTEKLPIAIRSLACADHAMNIPPSVLSILWFVGKRCNYDCSYCSPHAHDAVSPFMSLDKSLYFADKVHAHCQRLDKKVRWTFTGGEPFIDPGFLPMCRHIHGLGRVEQMNVTTNGSLPLEIYLSAAEIFRGITFSLHLERSRSEIDRVIDQIVRLSRARPECFLSCNLMYLPGTTEWIKEIISTLDSNNISYVLRKITPPGEWEDCLPYIPSDQGKKSAVLLDVDQQSQQKNRWYAINDQTRQNRLREYYSQQEQDFLRQHSQKTPWQNIGVWFDDGSYDELNSDQLIARDQNSFQNWVCYAGVDNIYIDFDGQIYRGFCLEGGSIGRVGDEQIFSSTPIQCRRQWCNCAYDIPVRKASSAEHSYLINHQTDLANL